ncbi:unnamed protein product, partial [Staurois parvus]
GTAGHKWLALLGTGGQHCWAQVGRAGEWHCWAPIIRALIISALMIGADPCSDNCRFSACALMICVAPAVPPVSVHQCTSMPHISAHLSCL